MVSPRVNGGPLLELHILGTGPSECNPNIGCLTHPDNGGCECCMSTLTPAGKKNIRRNTSAMLRVKHDGNDTKPEDVKSILIDCGKSFLASALEWFPQKGFREIDALIITHGHSDAILGLDDLRGWTLNGNIQKSVDIYVNSVTLDEIKSRFPYLVSAKLATGSGAIPAMNFITFNDEIPFECHGVTVTPLPVHHGINFAKKEPHPCLGFMFNRSIVYLSDVSYIPESTWGLLLGGAEQAWKQFSTDELQQTTVLTNDAFQMRDLVKNGSSPQGRLSATHVVATQLPPILVIDCPRVWAYTSHWGRAVAAARRLKAVRTYLTGFVHQAMHSDWESICSAVEEGERPCNPPATIRGGLQEKLSNMACGSFGPSMPHSEVAEELKEIALCALEAWEGGPKEPLWLRPTFDGHMIAVDEAKGTCWDDEYAKEATAYH